MNVERRTFNVERPILNESVKFELLACLANGAVYPASMFYSHSRK